METFASIFCAAVVVGLLAIPLFAELGEQDQALLDHEDANREMQAVLDEQKQLYGKN